MLAVAAFALIGTIIFLNLARSKIFDRYPEAALGRMSALSLAGISGMLALYGFLPDDVRDARGVETVLYLVGGIMTTASCVSIGVYLMKIAPMLPESGQIGYSPESAQVATQVARLGGVALVVLSAVVVLFTVFQTVS